MWLEGEGESEQAMHLFQTRQCTMSSESSDNEQVWFRIVKSAQTGKTTNSRLSAAASTLHDDALNLSRSPRRWLQFHGNLYIVRHFGGVNTWTAETPLKSPIFNDLDRPPQKNGEFRISRRKFADCGDLAPAWPEV